VLGCPPDLAQTTAEEVERYGGDADLLARVMIWEREESQFGKATAQRVPDGDGGRSYGVLQIKGRPDLEHDVRRSLRAWLWIYDASLSDCGDMAGALRELSSGPCKRATRLVAWRESEATTALAWAYAVAWRGP
jgi:hypothetical protein